MIWLAWRQFRVQAIAVVLGAGALAAVLAVTAAQLASLSHRPGGEFLSIAGASALNRALYVAALVVYVLPLVVGAFWGAPLVASELETGTHRMVWNQSVTRVRWLGTKVAIAGLAAAAVSGVLSLVVTWWASPIDQAVGRGAASAGFRLPRLDPLVFGTRGVVPIAYTILAFVVGVAVGLTVRRTLPALVITFVLMAAMQLIMPMFVRPHLIPPVHWTTSITQENLDGMIITGGTDNNPAGPVQDLRITFDQPGAWVLANHPLDAAGHARAELPSWVSACVPADAPQPAPGVRDACFQRLAADGYHQEVIYQPGSRFWALQGLESAVLLGLSAMVLAFCFWRVRRVY